MVTRCDHALAMHCLILAQLSSDQSPRMKVCCVAESLEETATIGALINVCFMVFQGMVARYDNANRIFKKCMFNLNTGTNRSKVVAGRCYCSKCHPFPALCVRLIVNRLEWELSPAS